ncbi:glycoside hydrolase family 3 N-terminal domain-containing protein [Maricaulis sp. D1M11]|uniref:glycoside hydrolase family 3 N-terminal domain-containing protein n=1 Tax=Maricaulis sp. D1M11 TaxID=3076117 RepID=UPI0039B516E4
MSAAWMTRAASLVMVSAGLWACSPSDNPAGQTIAEGQSSASEAPSAWSPRVTRLLSEMSVEAKIGQLHQAAGGRSRNLNSRLTPEELDRVREGGVGSYLHVAGAEPLEALQRVAVEESEHGIPLLFAMDVVHGYRTIFPVPIAMAASWDEAGWEEAARISAEEAAASGLHWTFAPMIDISRDPRWGRIVEGGGSDPYLGSRMAVAQVNGYQGADLAAGDTILATAKHFGAYGAPTGGRDYGTADISERSLHEIYLPPFHAATQAGVGSMMTAFNDIASVPSTANGHLIEGVLRDEWGFDGFIVSDWNAIAELMNHGVAETRTDAAALALEAGVDMDMTSAVYVQDLAAAIEADPALLAALDRSVGRLLAWKEALGLFDTPYIYHDTDREAAELLAPDHRVAARRLAERSIVLLKNDNNTLPLAREAGSIAVIGQLAEDASTQLGSWRAQGRPDDVVSLLDGIRHEAGDAMAVSYAAGAAPRSDDMSGLPDAIAAAEAADRVVLVIGEDYDLSGEARSRSDIALPPSQQALAEAIFATGKPVTVVLVSGRPLAIPRVAEEADALLVSWMLGVEAGPALGRILFGDVSPAGRLPVNFPRATGAVPFTYSENPGGRPAHPDLERDTNRYMDQPITPLFPFGHGLAYSQFEYGEMEVRETQTGYRLSVTVRNSGDREADEVVQLYMRDPVARVARPRIELRGFERVTLAPGESVEVAFHLTPAQTAIFQAPGRWQVEAGRIEVMIGASSADIRARGEIQIVEAQTGSAPATALETRVEVIR